MIETPPFRIPGNKNDLSTTCSEGLNVHVTRKLRFWLKTTMVFHTQLASEHQLPHPWRDTGQCTNAPTTCEPYIVFVNRSSPVASFCNMIPSCMDHENLMSETMERLLDGQRLEHCDECQY